MNYTDYYNIKIKRCFIWVAFEMRTIKTISNNAGATRTMCADDVFIKHNKYFDTGGSVSPVMLAQRLISGICTTWLHYVHS